MSWCMQHQGIQRRLYESCQSQWMPRFWGTPVSGVESWACLGVPFSYLSLPVWELEPLHLQVTSRPADLGLGRECDAWRWSFSGIHLHVHDHASCAHGGHWLVLSVSLVSFCGGDAVTISAAGRSGRSGGVTTGYAHRCIAASMRCFLSLNSLTLQDLEGKEQQIEPTQ